MKALISVSDKTGVVELAQGLSDLGFDILSTGGTAKTLRQAEIDAREVSDLTRFPEILGGRVKTLHPAIFGGILYARGNPKHAADIETHQIPSIDWVIVNLYPFEKINLENKIPKAEMIEFIDIGGVTLLRAAAKNYESVVALCDEKDYAPVLKELKENGKVSLATKKRLAAKVFIHTAHYDSMIARYFREDVISDIAGLRNEVKLSPEEDRSFYFPKEMALGLKKVSDLRYGENPQQKAALYQESGSRQWGIVHAQQLQGKELSFNNYLDLDSAWQISSSFGLAPGDVSPQPKGAACVIVKHNNPCGAAIGQSALEAFQLAFEADPLSAFGGVLSFSSTVDLETAREVTKTFFECVVAPDFTPEALETFKKKQALRLLRQPHSLTLPYELDVKKVSGGFLLQDRDNLLSAEERVVTKRPPNPEEAYALDFTWKVCKFVKSNAIVLGRGTVTHGIGAGQTSRIDALKIAVQKMIAAKFDILETKSVLGATAPAAGGKLTALRSGTPLVMASDAFFPFRDCVDEAAKAGVTAVIQPGGSIRDQESIDAANEHNIAMVFTAMRHFRH